MTKDTTSKTSKIHKTGRKRAVYLIYESLVRKTEVLKLISDRDEIPEYSQKVLDYYSQNQNTVLDLITNKTSQKNYKLIPNIDLAILIVAFSESAIMGKTTKDILKKIVEDYIDIAKMFGAKDNSYQYIHAIVKELFKSV